MKKVVRVTTVALSLDLLLKGQLAFLDKHYEVIAVSGHDEHLKTVGEREGVRTVALTMKRQISPLKDLHALWKLYRLFKKEKPFIVHSITPKAGLLAMTAAYFARIPVRIHTFTGLIFPTKTGLMQKILIQMDKILCHFATAVYPEGQGVKADLIKFGITKKPLHVIANGNVNGIDTGIFDRSLFTQAQNLLLRKQWGINQEDFVFIFVGRLVKDKGVNELVSAFSKLEQTRCKLLLIGPMEPQLDPLMPETLAAISDNKNIITTGYQDDVRPFFAIADTLVFPSYREGFPNVVLQAGAMGLASIVSDICGCNEIITNSVNGIIVPVKDSGALFHAMQRLLDDLELKRRLEENARTHIQSRYEQHLVWEGLLKEYTKFENKHFKNV